MNQKHDLGRKPERQGLGARLGAANENGEHITVDGGEVND
jgi:hypothetical protein